jgi:protein phosphatase methylesterase 1
VHAVRALLLGSLICGQCMTAHGTRPEITDDAGLQVAVARARGAFLAQQDFTRFQVTVLVEDSPGRWLRGSVEGDRLAYPASCVKLAFMVAAVHWCREQGRAADCLDDSVRPMIVESDNVAAGVVLDTVSGAPNGPVEGTDWADWLERRRYVERLLDAEGLLGAQRLATKTYPTNSGESPEALESLVLERHGRNAMSADLSAQLMLAVASGSLEPQASAYMRSLLRRPTVSAHGSLGGGLPPGSAHENKIGNAYDTLEDIMYAELPNGRRIVVAAFSDGWNQAEPEPWDVARLGRFTELLIQELQLDAGLDPPQYLLAPEATRDDAGWRKVQGRGAYSSAGYLVADDAAAASLRWPIAVPRAGRYEVSVWYEASTDGTAAAQYSVAHAGGRTEVVLDQRVWGSRWIKLGDFDFAQGEGQLLLTGAGPGLLTADALRIARWPSP